LLDGFRFTFPVEVRFRDLDTLAHVNNAVYLTYLESARLAFWHHVTQSRGLDDLSIILARAEIDYRSPVEYGEALVIGVRVASLRRSSFTMEFRIEERATGRLVAEAKKVLVHYDYVAKKSTPIPDALRQRLLAQDPGASSE